MENKFKNFDINPLVPSDVNQLHDFIMANSERLKYYFPITLALNTTLEKTEEYIATKTEEIKTKTNFTFAIRNSVNQQIAGLMIIKKIDWKVKQAEFAYCIGAEFEGQGLTSFAVREMSKFAFEKLGIQTIQIIAHKTNRASCKVAEKNGFIWQRTLLKEFTPVNEEPLDMELYELYEFVRQ